MCAKMRFVIFNVYICGKWSKIPQFFLTVIIYDIMRLFRQTLLLAALLAFSSALAVDSSDPVILSIRNCYNKAQEAVKNNGKDKQKRSDMVTTLHYMVPGSGPTTETLQFFFNMALFGEESEFVDYRLYFITRKYNLGNRKFYEEYLYDNGQLVFVFKQGYNSDGKKVDKRLYYRNGEIYQVVGELTEPYETEITRYLANDYLVSFNNLIRNAKE